MYTCTLHCVSDVVVCTGKVIFVRPHLLRPAFSPDCFLMMYVAALSTRLLLVVHMMSVTLASSSLFYAEEIREQQRRIEGECT